MSDSGHVEIQPLLEAMRRRRVTRNFLHKPVPIAEIRDVLRAARWASSAGNRRIHRFLVLRNPETIIRLKPFAPGILGQPPALIVLMTDFEKARAENVQIDRDVNCWIDVGTAMMSMMLAADAVGLGSCPATSFSQSAVARVLTLPAYLRPELILQLGWPAPAPAVTGRRRSGPTAFDLTDWEQIGQREPDDVAEADARLSLAQTER